MFKFILKAISGRNKIEIEIETEIE